MLQVMKMPLLSMKEILKTQAQHFVPVSGSSTGFIFAPSLSNIMIAGLEYSIKPFANNKGAISNLQTALMANMYFRATEGRHIGTGYDKYIIRQEISWYGNWTLESTSGLFSDFGIGFKGGLYLPPTASDSAVNDDSNDPEFGGSVNISISF